MKKQLREIIYFSTLIVFLILFTLTVVSFYFIGYNNTSPLIAFFVRYHVLFMFINAILGLLFGFLSYYFLNKKIDNNQKEKELTIKSLLSLLSMEERKIILFLNKNKGGCTQYELTKIEGMTKLKVHRGLDKLEKKGIISKEKLGKINRVYLSKEIVI